MKSKDQTLLEEAYGKIVSRQQAGESLPHITKTLDDNKDLKFENKKDFYSWQQKNLPGLWDHADGDLHPELGPELMKAYQAGYAEKDYTNPYPEKTLWWWLVEAFNSQGGADV